ncbi:maleylpyruvate isomerase family mycothiol-dependent enzyme [Spirilliplanes yamanashiensis]
MHATKDFWLAAMRADGPALRAAVGEPDPATPVPSCPDWTVADLTRHVGGILAWVGGFAGSGTAHPGERPSAPELAWPETLAWFDETFARTLARLDALDPEQPAWNWAPQAKRAAFWHRRLAHELSVHRWDAQMAVGRAEPVEAKLAADGVSEVLDTWLPSGRRRGPTDRHGVLHLQATDAHQEWFVRLRGPGVALLDTATILDTDDHHARVGAAGTASDLLLTLWGRTRPEDVLTVTGDAGLLDSLRTG